MFKFFDGQTDGQTDRVITIGHPPSGRALINYVTKLENGRIQNLANQFQIYDRGLRIQICIQ